MNMHESSLSVRDEAVALLRAGARAAAEAAHTLEALRPFLLPGETISAARERLANTGDGVAVAAVFARAQRALDLDAELRARFARLHALAEDDVLRQMIADALADWPEPLQA
jgi:hypothetical protein